MTWHVLTLDITGAVVADTPFNSLVAAERFTHQQPEGFMYWTKHVQHHDDCECLDCAMPIDRPLWLDRFEAVLTVLVFFVIGFLLGCALS